MGTLKTAWDCAWAMLAILFIVVAVCLLASDARRRNADPWH